MTPILTGHTGTNADLINIVADFYIPDGAIVADVTYGKGAFWSKTDTSRFILKGTDITTGIDFSALLYGDGRIDVVVLDPPYMHGGKTVKESINKCYHNENTSHASVIRLYAKGIIEAARVLKKRGLLMVKCQDEIESGKQRLSSDEIKSLAVMLGFSVKDIFVLVQNTVPAMREKYQKTARKNHSYLIIFEYRG